MNIVHVVESTGGGVASMVQLIAEEQAKRGHNVLVIFSRREDTRSDFESTFHEKVRLCFVKMGGWGGVFSLLKINRVILSHNASRVFLHSSYAGFLGRVALFFDKKIDIFYIPHGISFLKGDVGRIKMFAFVLLEKLANLRRSLILPCSESEAYIIKKYMPSAKLRVVENAVKEIHIDRSEFDFHGDFIVLCAARITRAKRPLWFSEISKKVSLINNKINFVWVGDGDSKIKSILEKSGVFVTGWLAYDEVLDWLKRSACYLSTSEWEGMPLSLIEAQLAGIPVIASNCPGNIDVVVNDKTGWIFQSIDQAVDILVKIENNRSVLLDMAFSAKEVAKVRFNVSRYVNEIEDLIA